MLEMKDTPYFKTMTCMTAKIKNTYANEISSDSEAQISKLVQLGGSFGPWLAHLNQKITKRPCYSFS